MKKTVIIFGLALLSQFIFAQNSWEVIYEQEGNGGLLLNNLSSSGVEYDVFVSGRTKNSFTQIHISKINQWTKDQKWAQNFLELGINAKDTPEDVFALDKDHIWVCGYRGMISNSEQGGLVGTWNIQETPSKELFLTSIWFSNSKNGWAVGKAGSMVFTKNGGKTWKQYTSPINEHLSRVQFTDAHHGYILAGQISNDSFGRILITTDGGLHWEVQKYRGTGATAGMNGMYFFDANNGWVCGDAGFISHTNDGGKTWKIQQWFIDRNHDLYDIHFVSVKEGWACGDKGLLYHTTDGGQNWKIIDIGEEKDFIAIEFNGPYMGWVATQRKVYQLIDPRFKDYAQKQKGQ